MSEKIGTVFLMLVIFFLQLVQWLIMFNVLRCIDNDNSHEDKRFWLKMLPFAAFLGILWSFTPLAYVFLSMVGDVFFGSAIAGYIVVMLFSSVFTLAWIQIYLAAEHWRYEYYPTDGSNDNLEAPIE